MDCQVNKLKSKILKNEPSLLFLSIPEYLIHCAKAARMEAELKDDRGKRRKKSKPAPNPNPHPNPNPNPNPNPIPNPNPGPNPNANPCPNPNPNRDPNPNSNPNPTETGFQLSENQLLEQLQLNNAKIGEVENLIKTLQNRLETLQKENHAIKQRMESKLDDIFDQVISARIDL